MSQGSQATTPGSQYCCFPGLPAPCALYCRCGKASWEWHWLQQNPDSCLPKPTDLILAHPSSFISMELIA